MSVVVLASAVFLPAQTVLHVAPLDWVSQVEIWNLYSFFSIFIILFIVTRTLNRTYFKWKCISQVQQLWSLNYSGANSRLYFSSILQSAAWMCWTICSDTTTYSSLFSTWYAACWLSVIPTLLPAVFSMLLFTNSYLMPVRFHILCQPSWKNYSIWGK